MNVKMTVARLPEAIREALHANPRFRARLAAGEPLERLVSGPEWARTWAGSADAVAKPLLRWLVRTYGGLPFEEAAAEAAAVRAIGRTGADIRVALVRLRVDGILFAVRRTWGDRLLYVPDDMVAVWHKALYPAAAPPLPAGEDAAAEAYGSGSRLSLSLELLSLAADIRRHGQLPLTAKGAAHRALAAKLAAGMRSAAAEWAALPAPAGRYGPGVPPQLALALELGLGCGLLVRRPSGIAAASALPDGWEGRAPREIDALLLELFAQRYAAADPKLLFAATSARLLRPLRWHREREALAALADAGAEAAPLGVWLEWMASLGWMERGFAGGEPAFRWLIDPLPAGCAETNGAAGTEPGDGGGWTDDDERRQEAGSGDRVEARFEERLEAGLEGGFEDRFEDRFVFIQPDLEILVPPGTPLSVRWALEQVADRESADTLFVYRLSRASVMRAAEADHTQQSLTALLEEAAGGAPLPDAVGRALADWFGRIGKARLGDAKLLRLAEPELAERLAADAAAAPALLARLGELAFAVRPERVGELIRRLEELGYPPTLEPAAAPGSEPSAPATDAAARPASGGPARPAAPAPALSPGWPGPPLPYEPDGTLPGREEMFPGVGDIPAAWLKQPRRYHASTSRKLIERALAWRAALQIQGDDGARLFVPEALRADSGGWRLAGRMLEAADSEAAFASGAELSADEAAALMIVLPPLPY